MISEFFKIAFRNLQTRKLRSWLTTIGIIISIAIIFILVSLSLGLQNAVQEQFEELGVDKFFVEPRGKIAGPGTETRVNFTEHDEEIINRISGVRDTTPFMLGNVKLEYNDLVRYSIVGGVEEKSKDLIVSLKIEQGKYLDDKDTGKIVLGSQYYHNNIFKKPVEIGDKIIIKGEKFRVIGILESFGNPPDDKSVYITIDEFKRLFPEKNGQIDSIIVQIEKGEDLKEVSEKVEKKLRSERNVDEKNQDFRILTPEELLDILGNILNIITGFLLGVAGISLVVGAIGVANTMYSSVLERRREIGIMKAVGARNKDVLGVFVIESGLIGLGGGLIGIIIGAGFSKLVEYIAANQLGTSLLKAAFPFYLFAGCLTFAFFIGIISGTWPAWRAMKVKPVEVLRYE